MCARFNSLYLPPLSLPFLVAMTTVPILFSCGGRGGIHQDKEGTGKKNKWSRGIAAYIPLGRVESVEPGLPRLLPPPPLSSQCTVCEVVQGKRICQLGRLLSTAPAVLCIDSETGALSAVTAVAFDLAYNCVDGLGCGCGMRKGRRRGSGWRS